jgi:hypothetical protein
MANNYRLEFQRALDACDYDGALRFGNSIKRSSLAEFPNEDEWKLSDIAYTIGVEVGYAKGFVHATALIFVAMLAAAIWSL